jgi:hypothetical protein
MEKYKDRVKDKIKKEILTEYAQENIQMLLTVVQIVGGIIVTAFLISFGVGFADNLWVAGAALFLTILLPSSSKIKVLCSSEFLRQFSFYIFTVSVGVTIAFLSILISGISESLSKLPIGIWIYLASGLLMFYEFNRVEKHELRKGFRFVAMGLFFISIGAEIVILSHIWSLSNSIIQFVLVVVRSI